MGNSGVNRQQRGQGTFEYVLLLGGVLLIVVLALVVLQSSFFQSAQGVSDVQLKQCKVAAQQSTFCYDDVTIFNGSKTFEMLGYAANPLLCNCSDYNPDAFTVSVGTAGLMQIGFSSPLQTDSPVLFSSLSFDDVTATADAAPTTAYAFTITLPPGNYSFFLVLADRSIIPLAVQTVTAAADGRLIYSWDSLPSGSRVKVNPIGTKISEEEKTAAKNEKTQIPSAPELEKQAGANVQKKDVKAGWSFELLSGKDGKLRVIFTYVPSEDYADALAVTVPIAANRILKTHPASSSILANSENPEASDIAWDKVSLKAAAPFRVIIEFKPDSQDANTLSAEADAAIGKIKDKELAHKKSNAKSDCVVDFLCPSKAMSTPTPNPSASADPFATIQTGTSDFISEGQGCDPTSLLPLSPAKKCAQGLVCKVTGEGLLGFMTWKCMTDGSAVNPSATVSPSPSETPLALPRPSILPTLEPSVTPSSSPSSSVEPSVSPSPEPTDDSVPTERTLVVQSGSGVPYAALLVVDSSNPTSTESEFLNSMKTDYPRIDLISYSDTTTDVISWYPEIFVIDSNDKLDFTAVVAAFDNGAKLNLIGDASQYVSQLPTDGIKKVQT